MNYKQCLYCYQPLNSEGDFHQNCSRKIFGKPTPPTITYTNNQILQLAEKVVKSQSTITGVQAKLSLGIKNLKKEDTPQKFTIMGVWGNYILKPPSEIYQQLPELESLTMHLAQLAGIATVPHTLIKLASGELSYLTKRIDRKGKQKTHMEDMCQLTKRLTEAKYRGSYEQIGKVILKYSINPGLDIITFFEQVIFSFLTGNNDMHLKNFSLISNQNHSYQLSPAYDLIAAALVVENDTEELALTLNGKKRKLKKSDFEIAMERFSINKKAIQNIFVRIKRAIPQWHKMIDISFLSEEMKEAYQDMIDKRTMQIGL